LNVSTSGYADDVNLLGYNISTINKKAEALINARKEVGLQVNVEKTKSPISQYLVPKMQNKAIT
jgi:flagellar assembly factor FliW